MCLPAPNILFGLGEVWTEGGSRETSGLNMDAKMLREGVTGPFTVCPQPSLVSAWKVFMEGGTVEWPSWAASSEVQRGMVLWHSFLGVLSHRGACQGRGL